MAMLVLLRGTNAKSPIQRDERVIFGSEQTSTMQRSSDIGYNTIRSAYAGVFRGMMFRIETMGQVVIHVKIPSSCYYLSRLSLRYELLRR